MQVSRQRRERILPTQRLQLLITSAEDVGLSKTPNGSGSINRSFVACLVLSASRSRPTAPALYLSDRRRNLSDIHPCPRGLRPKNISTSCLFGTRSAFLHLGRIRHHWTLNSPRTILRSWVIEFRLKLRSTSMCWKRSTGRSQGPVRTRVSSLGGRQFATSEKLQW